MDSAFLTVVEKIASKLIANNFKLCIAESCSGGYLSNTITDFPGSSRFFDLSVVSYSQRAKTSVLGVDYSVIKKHGMVSEETAVAMAVAVAELGGSDVSLSITGVAGPELMEGKPVGLVYTAVSVRGRTGARCMQFSGSREEIKRSASFEALIFLNGMLDAWL